MKPDDFDKWLVKIKRLPPFQRYPLIILISVIFILIGINYFYPLKDITTKGEETPQSLAPSKEIPLKSPEKESNQPETLSKEKSAPKEEDSLNKIMVKLPAKNIRVLTNDYRRLKYGNDQVLVHLNNSSKGNKAQQVYFSQRKFYACLPKVPFDDFQNSLRCSKNLPFSFSNPGDHDFICLSNQLFKASIVKMTPLKSAIIDIVKSNSKKLECVLIEDN